MPALIESGGSIVVIGSRTGKGPLFGRTLYAASKLALVGLVRTLALEAGPHGVRVNLISPGAVSGERIDGVLAAQAEARGVDEEQIREELTAQAPLGKFVAPRRSPLPLSSSHLMRPLPLPAKTSTSPPASMPSERSSI